MPENPLIYMHPAELRESEENKQSRSISPARYDALKHALRAQPSMLQARPVIVDLTKGDVIAGAHRVRVIQEVHGSPTDKDELLLAKLEEWGGVPVFAQEFTPAERREWMIRDNQGYAEYIPEGLAAIVAEHDASGADLDLLGLPAQELSDLLKLADDDDSIDEDPPDDDIPADTWGVVIECDDEAQQAELLEELSERGLSVRALIA